MAAGHTDGAPILVDVCKALFNLKLIECQSGCPLSQQPIKRISIVINNFLNHQLNNSHSLSLAHDASDDGLDFFLGHKAFDIVQAQEDMSLSSNIQQGIMIMFGPY